MVNRVDGRRNHGGTIGAVALAALTILGCNEDTGDDPCAAYPGITCIALHVEQPAGAGAVSIDQIAVTATTGFRLEDARTPTTPLTAPAPLPVVIAIVPGSDFSGAFALAVRGLLRGDEIGSGDTTGMVASGAHTSVTVTLLGSAVGDGGSDASAVRCASEFCLGGTVCDPCTGTCVAPAKVCDGGVSMKDMNGDMAAPDRNGDMNGDMAGSLALMLANPSIGPNSGGIELDLEGSGFVSGNGLGVMVDGIAATNVVWHMASWVSCTLPADGHKIGAVPVTVTNPSGQSVTRADLFKYEAGFTFLPAATVWNGSGTGGFAIAKGDFNADGKVDLITFDYEQSNQSFATLVSAGDGTFRPIDDRGQIGQFEGASRFGVGDFDGDGKLDVITGGEGAVLFSGQGDGTFTRVAQVDQDDLRDLQVGDLDGDGKLDFVTALSGGNSTLKVYLGKGGGGFQNAVAYAAAGAIAVAIADANGDGKLDLIAAGDASAVAVLLGNGDGTFKAAVTSPAGDAQSALVAADVNGDHIVDLAVLRIDMNDVAILLGNGDGTFGAPTGYPVGKQAGAVIAGDWNGDHKIDLAITNQGDNSLTVFLGKGDGTLLAPATIKVGGEPTALVTLDMNGDGKADLAVEDQGGETIDLLLGKGDGTFQSATNIGVGEGANSLVLADFNGDKKLDLAVVDSYLSGSISLIAGRGDGTFFPPVAFDPQVGNTYYNFVAAADFNGDGKLDLATAMGGPNMNGSIYVMANGGGGTFQPPLISSVDLQPSWIAVGDANGDGKPDLAVANSGSFLVSILIGKGDGTFQPEADISLGTHPAALTFADLNGDGKLDLAVAKASPNPLAILLGKGDGTFLPPALFGANQDLVYSIATGDLDGDGKLDIVVGTDAGVSIFLGKGDGTVQPEVAYVAGQANSLALLDLNSDGRVDIAYAAGNTNCNGGNGANGLVLLAGLGDGTLQMQPTIIAAAAAASLVAGDLNGDGKPDLAIASLCSDTMSIFINASK